MLQAPAVLAIMSSNTISHSFVWIIIAASTAGVGIFYMLEYVIAQN